MPASIPSPTNAAAAVPGANASAPVRLNKFLAERGVASRRRCDELIAGGKVSVDGRLVTELGTRIDPRSARVEVGGELLEPEAHPRYYLLNKPRGVICTSERREARPRAIDLIGDPDKGRIFTVGRLDEESEGLILLTSDGEFAQRVSHPRHGVSKTYLVKLRGRVDGEALSKVARGVRLAEGRTSGARLWVKKRTGAFTLLEVTLAEGMNRELRRIFAQVGFKVQSLKRVRIGPISDRRLKAGQWRPLVRSEVAALLSHSEPGAAERGAEPDAGPRVYGRGAAGRGDRTARRQPPRGRRFGPAAARQWTHREPGTRREPPAVPTKREPGEGRRGRGRRSR